jgi:hypothetical protein
MAKSTAQVATSITPNATPEMAEKMLAFQDQYGQMGGNKGLFLACVTALDRPENERKQTENYMHEVCKEILREFRDSMRKKADAQVQVATPEVALQRARFEHELKLAHAQNQAVAGMVRVCSEVEAAKMKDCLEGSAKFFAELSKAHAGGPAGSKDQPPPVAQPPKVQAPAAAPLPKSISPAAPRTPVTSQLVPALPSPMKTN